MIRLALGVLIKDFHRGSRLPSLNERPFGLGRRPGQDPPVVAWPNTIDSPEISLSCQGSRWLLCRDLVLNPCVRDAALSTSRFRLPRLKLLHPSADFLFGVKIKDREVSGVISKKRKSRVIRATPSYYSR